jgi:hypothetical protein
MKPDDKQNMLSLFFDPEDRGDVPPKRWLIFNELHGIIYRKIARSCGLTL